MGLYQWGTDGNLAWGHISGAQMEIWLGTISLGALAEIVVRNGAEKKRSRRIERDIYIYKESDKTRSLGRE